ncbi:MAG: peptidylprolyl isomerase [Actinomycetota bacterium]
MPIHATLVTSMGDIRIRLLEETAPITVENFVGLARGTKPWTHPQNGTPRSDPLYSGTIFHRVIPKFMIQGGDPIGKGTEGPGYRFEDEVEKGPSFDKPGYLAMANSGPNTNGSQFFVTVAATPWLTRKHTIFGEVVEGQEIADAISKVPTISNRPNTDVVLHEVRIEER